MADSEQFSPPNADGVRVKQGKSDTGAPFEIRFEEIPGEQSQSFTTQSAVSVHWPVAQDGDDSWKDSGIAKTKGIVVYRLRKNTGGSVYDWKLEFINTSGWGFRFWDASGDSYPVSTIFNGRHELLYSSTNPTIVKVD